jgi:hypothetical protein
MLYKNGTAASAGASAKEDHPELKLRMAQQKYKKKRLT